MLQEKDQGRQKKHTDRWLSLFMGISAAICMSIVLMMEASVTSLALDLTGTVNANTLVNNFYTLTGDTTINVDSLENDITIQSINLSGKTLRITGNSAHSIILEQSIYGNGNVIIEGGSIKNQSDSHLIYITGNIEVLGGNIVYTGTVSALSGNNVLIKGGNITCQNSVSSGTARISADSNLTIEGGTITIDPGSAAGLFSNNDISISGGSITVNNSDAYHAVTAISSFGTISITGGEINLTVVSTDNTGYYSAHALRSYNGIELSENNYILSPDGGSVTVGNFGGNFHYSITDADENVATHVHIKTRTGGNGGGNVVPGRPASPGTTISAGEPEVKLPPCDHNYEWRVITEATATADGVEGYICTKCGDVKERRGLAALGVFEDQTSDEVLNAPANGTVNIECMPWNSFGHAVKEAMTKRPDVTIKASFLSKGHTGIPLKVTIPAGRVDLFDSNGYLGLCRAGLELGYDN